MTDSRARAEAVVEEHTKWKEPVPSSPTGAGCVECGDDWSCPTLLLARAVLAGLEREKALEWANRTQRELTGYDMRCTSCGAPHNLDTVIPGSVWNQIAVEGEVLCSLCMDERLGKKGLTAEAEFFYMGRALFTKDSSPREQPAPLMGPSDRVSPSGGEIGESVISRLATAERERDLLRVRLEGLRGAAEVLVACLTEATPHINAVCEISQIHGLPYRGKSYGEPLALLRAALDAAGKEGE